MAFHRANEVYDEVHGNLADLGLVACPVMDARLEIIPLRKEPLAIICHPRHPFARQKSVKLKQLADQKMTGFEPDIPTRKALDKILRGHRVEVKPAMEFDNLETVKRAVEFDVGVAILPLGAVTQEVGEKTLAAVVVADGESFRPLAAIYKKNKVFSPARKPFPAVLKSGV